MSKSKFPNAERAFGLSLKVSETVNPWQTTTAKVADSERRK